MKDSLFSWCKGAVGLTVQEFLTFEKAEDEKLYVEKLRKFLEEVKNEVSKTG